MLYLYFIKQTPRAMKKLTNYEVNELLSMLSEMTDLIEKYSHVSDKLPGLKSKIDKTYSDLCTESDKREI